MGRLFSTSHHSNYQLLVTVLLSLALLAVDQRSDVLSSVRHALSYATGAVQRVAYSPFGLSAWLGEGLSSHATLLNENRSLRQQNLVLSQKAQQVAVLTAENVRLRELLNSSSRVTASVSVAEIIAVSPDPDRQELVINRGSRHDVYEGQVVLDAHGVMGQVVRVGAASSHVLLINDANHAMSVQDNRSGLHGILSGNGQSRLMTLLYVQESSDVQVGDLLVSSGLEGRFPKGYPVARVVKVERSRSSTFLSVYAQPEAHIQQASHVLLLSREESAGIIRESADVE